MSSEEWEVGREKRVLKNDDWDVSSNQDCELMNSDEWEVSSVESEVMNEKKEWGVFIIEEREVVPVLQVMFVS